MGHQSVEREWERNALSRASAPEPAFSGLAWPSRWLIACVFWILCLTLSAAGHRLYKATVTLDRRVSADAYRSAGAALVWIGQGAVEDSYERMAGKGRIESELHVLPNSRFWLGAAFGFSLLGGVMAWSGRWIANQGLQSLVGLIAGHLLWLGAIELGLDAAGRRLGLAASFDVVGDRVVGTHAAGTLIQLSVVFLAPVFIGLTMHESNRCAVFHWFRVRLPILRRPAPTGRIENYAARTAMQFFMTVWFCYVSVLWLADPLTGRAGELGLVLCLAAIVAATPYMMWRTARQRSAAMALRYSVSGAVVTWTAIEIAASMQLFREPWLSTTFASGMVLLGLSTALTCLAAYLLRPGRATVSAAWRNATALVAAFCVAIAGCSGADEAGDLTAQEIEQRLLDYERQIGPPPAGSDDGMLHALGSPDPKMRAQAAISLGKSGNVSPVVRQSLLTMATGDDSRLAQAAALHALKRLKLLSPDLQSMLTQFDSGQGAATGQ